jgi:hypothetical protein
MAGTLRCRQVGIGAAIAVMAMTVACARNVVQNSHSGKDATDKGARSIELEAGSGQARDIVTYPGGDRVDWKKVTLPEGKRGSLTVRLSLRPARPGMDVAFTVYDQWMHRVARVKPSKSGKRKKKASVSGAAGTYYIQVYAPRRSDAAAYRIEVDFDEAAQAAPPDALLAGIPEPPHLPAVPAPAEEPAVVAQPPLTPPDDEGAGSASTPAAAGPLTAQVVKVQASDGGIIVTLDRGKEHGVDRGWRGQVLQGSGNSPLSGGQFTIITVSARRSVAKIKLSIDQIRSNRRALLSPP